jgi:COP9 signalosome complex subunit 4
MPASPSFFVPTAMLIDDLVREQLYVNISFSGLGALLDLAPSGAETMARRMIEQERLRGWIEFVVFSLFLP